MHGDLEAVLAAKQFLSNQSGRARLGERLAEDLVAAFELAADVDERVFRTDRVAPDEHPFDHLMRRLFDEHPIFERSGLGFVGVADHVARPVVFR